MTCAGPPRHRSQAVLASAATSLSLCALAAITEFINYKSGRSYKSNTCSLEQFAALSVTKGDSLSWKAQVALCTIPP